MPSWIVTPVIGLFGLMLTWGEWIEAALGPRGRKGFQMLFAATFVFGAVFAREELGAVFVRLGEEAAELWTDAIRDSVSEMTPTTTSSPGSP